MIELKENCIDVETYLWLRKQVGWKILSEKQAAGAIGHCLYNVVAYDDGKAVGMGRIVGDGCVVSYIQDLVVIPEYQKSGVGSLVISKLIEYVKSITEDGTEMMLCLMCAKGREGFYIKHGFTPRPTDSLGPGMIQYISRKQN